MMLKRTSSDTLLKRSLGAARKAALGVASLGIAASLTAGCLQRPVKKQDPQTNNVYVDQIRQTAVDKIDLLFMIDNSISMADKQAILGEAVPVLLSRLITPICVDAEGNSLGTTVGANGLCAEGEAEFSAISDIHIGIVSSSLGAHGGDVCTEPAPKTNDDKAQLIGAIRPGLTSWNNSGFLAWDPGGNKNSPPGENNADALTAAFTSHVSATGEQGCGFEASLEAWYRFLIDPDPPAQIVHQDNNPLAPIIKEGTDQTVLAQRAAFLRPDSLVAIVMLTDENDCSIVDEGQGWLVGRSSNGVQPYHLPASTSACAEDANSPCCRSCGTGESSPPSGCGDLASDSECQRTGGALPAVEDALNLRCYQQKRRFGFDLLYSTDRYVNGLTSPTVPDRAGNLVTNPLFMPADGKGARDKALVFLAGIVGVPWQDVATDDSLSGTGLTYLTAQELKDKGRWDVILGDPNSGLAPTDPLMIETPDPRQGTSPIVNAPLGPPESMDPQANPINGHEVLLPDRDDLQYACIFPLTEARQCTDANSNACDCTMKDVGKNRPLCNPPGGGAAGTTQYFAKAYPGTRHLQVLRDFGPNAIVASICPKVTTGQPLDPSYGYNPAVGAIIARLKEALTAKCLPRPLVPSEATGKVPCAVIETLFPTDGSCNCDIPGRTPASETIRPAVIENLQNTGQCGEGTGIDCGLACLCEINQFEGADLEACQNSVVAPANLTGYCYVEGGEGDDKAEENQIVSKCKATERRLLRFVPSADTPRKGAVTFIACIGASLGQTEVEQVDGM
jgi:hypothetical protein